MEIFFRAIFILAILSFTSPVKSQVLNIPDSLFLERLIIEGVDTNGDNEIQLSEALNVSHLNLSPIVWGVDQIKSLEGINYFVNLKALNLSGNDVHNLDVTDLVNLESLSCSFQSLETIDLPKSGKLEYLNLGNTDVSTIDLSQNSNIKILALDDCKIESLVISNLDNLEILKVNNNPISTLDISGNNYLKDLNISGTNIDSIEIGNKFNLEILNCSYTNIRKIDVTKCLNLLELRIYETPIYEIDVTNNTRLKILECAVTNISFLDISKCDSLVELNASRMRLDSIYVDKNVHLTKLYVHGNMLTNLNIDLLTRLKELSCRDNYLKKVNLYNNVELERLSIGYNPLDSIDVSRCLNLRVLSLQGVQLRSIDLSSCLFLQELNVGNNYLLNGLNLEKCLSLSKLIVRGDTSLVYLDLSNNLALNELDLMHAKNINSICVSPDNIDIIRSSVIQAQLNNCYLTPICSYGNSFANLEVTSLFTRLGGNCGLGMPDIIDEYWVITELDSFIYSTIGRTSFNIPRSINKITIKPIFNRKLFSVVPERIAFDSSDIARSDSLKDTFCLYSVVDTSDLNINLIPIGLPRPGFESCYKISYGNNGTLESTDSLKVFYPFRHVQFVSSTLDAISHSTGVLVFVYDTLLPFDVNSFEICFRLNSPVDLEPLNEGDSIKFSCEIFPTEGDMIPDDNVAVLCQRVVNSFDPNDKTCLEGDKLTPDILGGYIHYLIRFENLGSAEAINVTIRDIIDTSTFDINTLYTVDASHSPLITKVFDRRIVEFEFKDIYLPFDDDNNDGYVVFGIKPKDHVTVGDSLLNQADIYFDFNFPITTNNAISIVTDYPTFVPVKENTLDVEIFPNPTTGSVRLSAHEVINSVTIFTLDGRMVRQEVFVNSVENSQDLNISNLPDGIYFIRVFSDQRSGVVKVVKE